MNRFVATDGFVPRKVAARIIVPDEVDLSAHRAKGPQPGETLLEGSSGSNGGNGSGKNGGIQVDPVAMEMLTGMGFPSVRCEKALRANNNNAEAALEWIMMHMDDPNIDVPEPSVSGGAVSATSVSSSQGAVGQVDQGALADLVAMGFPVVRCEKALLMNGQGTSNTEAALNWLIEHMDDPGIDDPITVRASSVTQVQQGSTSSNSSSTRYSLHAIISHKGTSVHCGHYVAYVKDGTRWVLYNDCRVADATPVIASAKEQGYIYLFRRID